MINMDDDKVEWDISYKTQISHLENINNFTLIVLLLWCIIEIHNLDAAAMRC